MPEGADQFLPLTPSEVLTLQVIQEWIDICGHAPSMTALAHELGIRSRSGAWRQVANLIAKGWIKRHGKGRAYAISVAKRAPMSMQVIDIYAVCDIAAEAIALLTRDAHTAEAAKALAERLKKAVIGTAPETKETSHER
jgi:SOS-response transcriptional repressor LexA